MKWPKLAEANGKWEWGSWCPDPKSPIALLINANSDLRQCLNFISSYWDCFKQPEWEGVDMEDFVLS